MILLVSLIVVASVLLLVASLCGVISPFEILSITVLFAVGCLVFAATFLGFGPHTQFDNALYFVNNIGTGGYSNPSSTCVLSHFFFHCRLIILLVLFLFVLCAVVLIRCGANLRAAVNRIEATLNAFMEALFSWHFRLK